MIEKPWRESRRPSTWNLGAIRGLRPAQVGDAPPPEDRRFAPSPFFAFAAGNGLWFRAAFRIFLFLLVFQAGPVEAQLTLEKRRASESEIVFEGEIIEFSLILTVPPAEEPAPLRMVDDLPTLDVLLEPVSATVASVGGGISGPALQPGDSGDFQDLRFGDGRSDRVLFDFGSVTVSDGAGEADANRISMEISARAVSAVTTNLAHWWRLDDGAGTAARDMGAAAETRNGALVNMANDAWIADGRRAGAIRFEAGGDSAADFVRLAEDGQLPLRPDQPYTISLWFRTTGPGALLAKAGGTPEERQVYLFVNSGPDSLQAFVGGVFFPLVDVDVRDGRWRLATLVNDPAAGTATLYLDDGADFAVVAPGAATNDADVLLGARRETDANEGTAFAFSGDMDDVRIYAAPLSADQVRTLFQAESANRARAFFGDAVAEASAPVTVIPSEARIALSGRVGADADGDGAISGEEGLAGVWLVLSDLAGTPVAVQITDDQGRYRFADLSPGGWRIAVDPETLPGGLASVQDPQAPADGVAVLENLSAARDGLDFLYRETEPTPPDPPDPPEPPDPPSPPEPPPPPPAGAISGRVWLDENGNGLEDEGEPGASDVVLELRSRAGVALGRTRTGFDGGYGFSGIFPGDYRLVVIPPEGFRLTSGDADDPERNSDFDPETGAVSVAARDGVTLENLDAGLVPNRIVLAGRVGRDDDGDGEIGEGEGVFGVRLLAESEETASLVARTDAEGLFRFEDLPPGSWTVSVEPATLPESATFYQDPDDMPDGRVVLRDAREDRPDLDFRLRNDLPDQPADLAGSRIVGLDLDGPPLLPEDELEFRVVVYNAGDRVAEETVFFGETPEGAAPRPETVDTDRGAATLDENGRFRVFVGDLEPGGEAWIRWRATVSADAPVGGWIVVGGQVAATGIPAVPVDAADTAIPDDPLVLGPIAGPSGEVGSRTSPTVAQTVFPDGPVAAGDRLRFETILTVTGDHPAEDVRLINAVPLWTELDPASVFSDRGVTSGGNPIRLSAGSIPPGETVRLVFETVVRPDVPEHVRIASQSLALARGARARSDDPATAKADDSTVARSGGSSPALRLWMENAAPEPGTEVRSRERFFRATVENAGAETIRDVRFLDAPWGPVALIPGSVVLDRGTVVQGNGAGEVAVEVSLGELAPGESIRIRYGVRLRESAASVFPFSGKPFLLFRNGWLRADGLFDIRGDDPSTHAGFDGTPTIFVGVPSLW